MGAKLPDAEDLLWIDLNRDGAWDPVNEQFRMSPILRLNRGRYAVLADEIGNRLTLEPLKGAGVVRLSLAEISKTAHLVELSGMFVGRDGSAITITAERAEATVPIGEYRL
jgi:hypothetical protein